MSDEDHKTSQDLALAVSPNQQQAIEVLLTGGSDSDAAKAASVTRETVCRWRHSDADFIAALNRERLEAFEATRDSLRRASLKAITALSELLSHETYPPMRLKAASIVLRSMGALGATLAPGETNPEDIRADWRGARYRRELRSLGG